MSCFIPLSNQTYRVVGEVAKQIFERAQLPNEVLGRIWNLADTEQKGRLGSTEFIIAMHLLASYRNGSLRALPQMLPAGLYEAAARRGTPRQTTGPRPFVEGPPGIPRQFSGSSQPRTSSPLAGPSPSQGAGVQLSYSDDWAISSQEKAQFDQIFASVDTSRKGFVTGEEAVGFFSNSRLPEEILAQIWDLADIHSEGQLNRDEFAVAMYLIKQQRAKTDGRGVLPQSLPPNLVPPSMRNQAMTPGQPTAPTFDNTAHITASKSASEDLFGLDAAASSPQASAQATPDRATFTSSPAPASSSPQTTQQAPRSGQGPHSIFKPFVPSSSFGQSILHPQTTGQSQTSPSQPQPSRSVPGLNSDDLLGDTDPEVSKKLTQETSELANLSNQVSSLTGQMQQVKSKHGSTEQDLTQAQSQKREFESRLSQLRTTYEQEAIRVRTLEDHLSAVRRDNAQLQRDIAMLSGTLQDLQSQHSQLDEALRADQAENANLRERIRQTNAEISSLKTQLEKMRLDAKKQQGLVAINKKQLLTTNGERDKVQHDIKDAAKEHEEATTQIQNSSGHTDEKSPLKPSLPTVKSPPALPRSGSTTSSMNPFFRQNTGESAALGPRSPFDLQGVDPLGQNTFDNLFGPSPLSSPQASGPTPTMFQGDSPAEIQPAQQSAPLPRVADLSREAAGFPSGPSTPSTSEPPPPPQSRQITSSYLPLRAPLDRADSTTSSVKVVPPASRLGSTTFDSSLGQKSLSGANDRGDIGTLDASEESGPPTTSQNHTMVSMSQHTPPSSEEGGTTLQEPNSDSQPAASFSTRSISHDIPGAFPGDSTPPKQSDPSVAAADDVRKTFGTDKGTDVLPENNAAQKAHVPTSSRGDFDSAFQDYSPTATQDEPSNSFVGLTATDSGKKFPGIQEFEDDDGSDSDAEGGFDDNFTSASPRSQRPGSSRQDLKPLPNVGTGEDGTLGLPKRPFMPNVHSNASPLPTPGAQQSPPSYDQSVPSSINHGGQRSTSQSFPAEYSGLLPSREDPTSPPPNSLPSGQSPVAELNGKGKEPEIAPHNSNLDMRYGTARTDNFTSGPAPQPPGLPSKTPADDFDKDFADLSEAKEATDEDVDPPGTVLSRGQSGFDEFNPTFDSPTPSRSTMQAGSSTFSADNNSTFRDFENSINQSFGTTGHAANASLQNQTAGQQNTGQNHDWDAMFAGLDTSQNNEIASNPPTEDPSIQSTTGVVADSGFGTAATDGGLKAPSRPDVVQRSLTGEDDPILKDLTSMGYPRQEALQALEKYDYNLDVVSQTSPLPMPWSPQGQTDNPNIGRPVPAITALSELLLRGWEVKARHPTC